MGSIGSISLCAYVMTCNHMCTCVCVWGVQAKHQGVHGSQRCTRTIVEIQHGLELGPIVTLTAFCNLQMEAEGVTVCGANWGVRSFRNTMEYRKTRHLCQRLHRLSLHLCP
jgi:hypothetical protein